MTDFERVLASVGIEYGESVYCGSGVYRIRLERQGKRRTANRRVKDAEDLGCILSSYHADGCRIIGVRFAGA